MFLLTGCSLGIFAQNRTITGTVRDAVDVVIGASVTVKGNSSIGTITDMDGKFRISVPSSARDLVIKFIGYDDAVIRLGTPTDYVERVFRDVGRSSSYWLCQGEA